MDQNSSQPEKSTNAPQTPSQPPRDAGRDADFFRLGVLVEGGLLLIGIVIGSRLTPSLLSRLAINLPDTVAGVGVALPMLVFFLVSWHYPVGPLRGLRRLLEDRLVPLIVRVSRPRLIAVCLLAGSGEELVFRGLIQTSLDHAMGPIAGLLLASVIFGLAHCLSWTYLVIAALIGAYLGLVYMAAGNLWPVIIAHALYDYVAVEYILWRHRKGRSTSSTSS